MLKSIGSLLAWLVLVAAAMAPAQAQDVAEVDLAVVVAPAETSLEDILANRAKLGFTPVLTRGIAARARTGHVVWVRLRADLPARAAGDWVVRMPRIPVDSVVLQQADSATADDEAGFFRIEADRSTAGAFRLDVPAGDAGTFTYFLRIEGNARFGLHPQLLSRGRADAADRSERWPALLAYGLLLVIVALAVVRHLQSPRSNTLRLAVATALMLVALLAIRGDLYALPGASGLARFGSVGLWVLWMLPCGPLLLAVAMFSGLMRSAPKLHDLLSTAGWVLPVLLLGALAVPEEHGDLLQLASWAAWLAVAAASLLIVAMDSRAYRLGGLLVWMGLMTTLAMRMLADLQVIEADWLSLYAFEPMLVVLLACYLLLPWVRASMQDRAALRRHEDSSLSPEQKIAEARLQLMSSLQKGLGSALGGGDVQWIAFRRLLDGLKPVLKQTSSAVVAMEYHGEDLLQVEPRTAEERYRLLVGQRGNLLKSLSRSKAPQQISVDFDGEAGPLEHVQLAAIPLPIDKPGWGLLLIEREKGVTYSDAELDLCTEFAALATTASDEAAITVEERRAAEIDPDTGLFRRELVLRELNKQYDQVLHRVRPLTVIRLRLDNLAKISETSGGPAALACLHDVGKMLRAELEYGETVGRYDELDFLLVIPGKTTGLFRPVVETLKQQIERLPYSPAPVALFGMTEMRRGDVSHLSLADRSGQAVEAARRSGAPASL